jgi:hypothetical protein
MKADYEATKPNWLEGENADTESLTNYDALMDIGDEFPRNITPPSILPFSIKNRMSIMSGHLFIRVTISNAVLKGKLSASGWTVEDNTDEPPAKSRKEFAKKRSQTKGNFYSYGEEQSFTPFKLSREDNGRRFYIAPPYEATIMMLSSFHSLDFIVKAMDEIYTRRKQSNMGSIMLNFSGENSLFCKTRFTSIFYSISLSVIVAGTYLKSLLFPSVPPPQPPAR